MDQLTPAEPVFASDLLAGERRTLLDLLDGLEPADWDRSTECPAWTVKGICLHLLGDDLSLLARQRDSLPSPVTQQAGAQGLTELLARLDRFNEAWVAAAGFLSPSLVCQLLALSGQWAHAWYTTVDPHRRGEPVAWAGPEPAPYWFLAAREYLERWIHQQQIRRAVSASPLDHAHWVVSAVAVAARSFPARLARLEVNTGATVSLTLPEAAWTARKDAGSWQLYDGVPAEPTATLEMHLGDAAKLFSRGLRAGDYPGHIRMLGDKELGSALMTGLDRLFGR